MKLTDIGANLRRNRHPEEDDLGFGAKIGSSGGRLINRDGSFNVVRTGIGAWTPYQTLVEMPWGRFFGLVVLFYLGVNLVFASLFLLVGVQQISGATPGALGENFANAFFLSVQTFTTVGYGALSPQGIAANIVAAFDALTGLMSLALATGLLFARFSKPRAQILFSEHAIIAPYQHGMSFQFRIANLRNNNIINLKAKVNMTWMEEVDGRAQRRFAGLSLERDQVFLFPLNWTIVHPINAKSPLWGKTLEDLRQMRAEFIILLQGYDETFAQDVHTNGSYTSDEIIWNARFQLMYFPKDGHTELKLDRINDIVRLEESVTGKA